MALLEMITEDMISAMKKKDSFSLGVIRMAKGAVSLEAINKKRDLTDEEVVDVIVKQIKLRKDAILEFTKANRMDLVSQNEKEIEVLNKYLPEQLSSEEVIQIIDDASRMIVGAQFFLNDNSVNLQIVQIYLMFLQDQNQIHRHFLLQNIRHLSDISTDSVL